jgi:3-dehydroquinate dehydratase
MTCVRNVGKLVLRGTSCFPYVLCCVNFLKRTEDQKLIYSGQLLHDSVTLKDILRRYEGQEAHTVHLVCTPSRDSVRHTSTAVTRASSRMSDNGQMSTSSSRGGCSF